MERTELSLNEYYYGKCVASLTLLYLNIFADHVSEGVPVLGSFCLIYCSPDQCKAELLAKMTKAMASARQNEKTMANARQAK